MFQKNECLRKYLYIAYAYTNVLKRGREGKDVSFHITIP